MTGPKTGGRSLRSQELPLAQRFSYSASMKLKNFEWKLFAVVRTVLYASLILRISSMRLIDSSGDSRSAILLGLIPGSFVRMRGRNIRAGSRKRRAMRYSDPEVRARLGVVLTVPTIRHFSILELFSPTSITNLMRFLFTGFVGTAN